MNNVFGDESYDGKKERVFAVAGLFGTEDDWKQLEAEWVKLTKGKEIHASECETVDKDFYRQLVTVLAGSKIFGFGAVMSLQDYSRIFDQSTSNLPYYFCFFKVVEHFARFTQFVIPQDRVKLTFDRNLETQHNTTFLYNYLIKLPEWKDREFLSEEISFSSRKNPKIQAADLWAREIMKHGERAFFSPSHPIMRLSLQALRREKRFGFDMFDKEYFENMKKQIRERHEPGHAIEEYHAWREANKIQDTTEHRIRYHMYLNMLENAGKK